MVPRGPYQEPEPRSYGTIGNILFKKFVIMVQFIRPRTIFGLGRVKLRPSHRVESGFSARGCPHCTELCIAHYFIIQNLRLSKNFPPFGRRVAVSSLHQNHRTSLPVFCCRRVQAQTRANAALRRGPWTRPGAGPKPSRLRGDHQVRYLQQREE